MCSRAKRSASVSVSERTRYLAMQEKIVHQKKSVEVSQDKQEEGEQWIGEHSNEKEKGTE